MRTESEYKGGHIKEAENVPLDKLADIADDLKKVGTVYVNCGSGVRSCQATDKLEKCGVNVVNVEGGISAWLRDGFGITKKGKAVMPIIRQVMIGAGALVLLGVMTSLLVHPAGIYIAVFVGLGMIFAGVTGICGMQKVLAMMPWNK